MRRQRFARASESAEAVKAVKALTRRAEKVPGLEQVHSRSVMDQVRGVWTSQNRAMVRRQRRQCPDRWAAVMVEAAMVAWQGRSRHTPGQLWTR
jgi:hypothetical protein